MKKVLTFFILALFLMCGSSAKAAVVGHLKDDVERTFTGWPVLIVIGGANAALGTSLLDSKISSRLSGNAVLGRKIDNIASVAGSPYAVGSAAAITYLTGKASKNENIQTTGEALIEALIITESATLAIKGVAQRTRPNGGHYSFPSGHASRTFAVAGTLGTLHGPLAGVPAFIFAGFVAFSRLDGNVHYLSDVVFGSALGTAIGIGTALHHKDERDTKLAIYPLTGECTGMGFAKTF